MKLACVVHRFGTDFAGGSEAHCRQVAERLAANHQVTILTSCARDHMTWRNEYPAGESTLGPLTVRRFPVVRERSMLRFREISEKVFAGRASDAEQEHWFHENGPEVPDLLEYLRRHGRDFDLILFWAFRYAEVFFGLPLVADRAVLVPTAEEDPLMRATALDPFFARPAGFLFLTPEEEALVWQRTSAPRRPAAVVGSGLLPRPTAASAGGLAEAGVQAPFLLYLGRVDPNKGCATLLKHFVRYASEHPDSPPLVLAGPANMPIPGHPKIKALGFVSEAVREALLTQALLQIVPSRFESLSLALLEGWNHALPALVNRHCAVLKGQAIRSEGALYYGNYDEFAGTLSYLLAHPGIRAQMGRQGLAYVEREYRWPTVMSRIEALLAEVVTGR